MATSYVVQNAAELQAAVADGVPVIEVSGTISGSPRIVLAPGVRLTGGRLEVGSKGVMLTRDNTLQDVEIVVPEHEMAVYADTTQADWELELGVIIGRAARHVSRAEALSYVAGYTIVNDLTSRDKVYRADMKAIGTDWLASKSSPSYLPMGPYLVPAAFVADPQQLHLTLKLNGQDDLGLTHPTLKLIQIIAPATPTMLSSPETICVTLSVRTMLMFSTSFVSRLIRSPWAR